MTDTNDRPADLRQQPGVCQHDLLEPNCTVTVRDNDPYTGSCWVCRRTWSTRHIILDQVVEDRFTGQQPAQPLDVSHLPMGDPHPIELVKTGCDPVTGQPAQPDIETRIPTAAEVDERIEVVSSREYRSGFNDCRLVFAQPTIDRLQSALAAAKAYADDTEARYHTAHERLTSAQQRIAELESELENERARGIHTCHDQCQRPLCVARRRIAHIVAVVNPHIADLARVAAIFREHGMHDSADEAEKAISELRTALKDPA